MIARKRRQRKMTSQEKIIRETMPPRPEPRKRKKTAPPKAVKEALNQVLHVITNAADERLPAIMDRFRKHLDEPTMRAVTHVLVTALLKSSNATRQRLTRALSYTGPFMIFEITNRLSTSRSIPSCVKLIQALGEIGDTDIAVLLPLLRAKAAPQSEIREAAQAAIQRVTRWKPPAFLHVDATDQLISGNGSQSHDGLLNLSKPVSAPDEPDELIQRDPASSPIVDPLKGSIKLPPRTVNDLLRRAHIEPTDCAPKNINERIPNEQHQ